MSDWISLNTEHWILETIIDPGGHSVGVLDFFQRLCVRAVGEDRDAIVDGDRVGPRGIAFGSRSAGEEIGRAHV